MTISLRAMTRDDWPVVAALIHASTNSWYENHGHAPAFTCPPEDCQVYCEVYETLDPGCCVVAVDDDTNHILGSCFYHPRASHVSLGIMNAHPDAFGRGVARDLLDFVIDVAGQKGLPVRLVSSAMNLDSFSLYNRRGFTPFAIYQDMVVTVPTSGFEPQPLGLDRVRPAQLSDVPAMVALEQAVAGIERGGDFEYFLRHTGGIWHTTVLESRFGGAGELDGFLVSVAAPASNMLGPGVMRTPSAALALIAAQLDHHRGRSPVFLVPANEPALTAVLYDWGARNCELHFAQVLGEAPTPVGVTMPTFLPETS